MIRNLNPLTFTGFGTVISERANASTPDLPRTTISASGESVHIYQAVSETWVFFTTEMTILSVSADGTQFQDFYLDKTVCIQPGIYFCIQPFHQSQAQAEYAASQPIRPISDDRRPRDLRTLPSFRITAIYTFFYHEKEQSFFFPGEAHPFLELTYVDRGALHSVADGLDLTLSEGDMALYGPNQWHMQYADIGVAPRFVTISFDADGLDLSSLLNRKIAPPQKAVTLLQQMLREQERMTPHSNDLILAQLTMLMLSLVDQSEKMPEKPKASNSLHSDNEIIRQAQQYISTHIRQKLSVPLVARAVDVSPSYLTALFHKHLQISPGEYIRRMKLQESKQMIRENSMNFTEIAAALQYSTVHHFSRQFKEKFGITPSEYARSVR